MEMARLSRPLTLLSTHLLLVALPSVEVDLRRRRARARIGGGS